MIHFNTPSAFGDPNFSTILEELAGTFSVLQVEKTVGTVKLQGKKDKSTSGLTGTDYAEQSLFLGASKA